jgi:L-asparaginase
MADDQPFFLYNTMNMVIRIIVTGGTFDKEYNEIDGDLYFKNSHVQNMLELGRSRLDLNIRTLMMIDS